MKRGSGLGTRKKLAFAAVTTGLFAAALALAMEIGIRALVPAPMWRFRDSAYDWRPDPVLGWVNKPDMDDSWRAGGGEEPVRYRTNPDGLVPFDATRRKTAGVVRVMVFGDSMVVARRVPQDRIYTARLEAELAKRGVSADVINAGVLGYSTDQSLLLMERMLPLYQPEVVLFGHTLNDHGGNSSRHAYRQPKPMFVLEGDVLRLIPPEPSDRIQKHGIGWRSWIQQSALYRILQPRIRTLRARTIGWRERNLLGLDHLVFFQPELLDRIDWRLFQALLARMQEAARAHGARFLLFSHPEASEVWDPHIEALVEELGVRASAHDRYADDRRVGEAARAAGVPRLPLIDAFVANQSRGLLHLLPYDGHLGPEGHQLLAELLADHLVEAVLPDAASPGRQTSRRPDQHRRASRGP